jgi:hypothetical protein
VTGVTLLGGQRALAHEWAAAGFKVLPLSPKKQPRIKGAFHNATSDHQQIDEWWDWRSDCIVGVVPGSGGCIVLDVDDNDGKGGSAQLASLELQRGPLPPSPSMHDGKHLWYRKHHEQKITQYNGLRIQGTLVAPHIDVRSDVGHVVAYDSPPDPSELHAFPWDIFPDAGDPGITPTTDWEARAWYVTKFKDHPDAGAIFDRLMYYLQGHSPAIKGDDEYLSLCHEGRTTGGCSIGKASYYDRVNVYSGYWIGKDGIFIPSGPRSIDELEEIHRKHTADEDELIFFDQIQEEEIDWLWQDTLALGKLAILEGDPDKGKSTITCDWAARTTNGTDWPDGSKNTHGPMSVLIIAAEDTAADVIKPRLAASGANMSLVAPMPRARDEQGRVIPMMIPEDLERIKKRCIQARAKTGFPVGMIIIDPVTAVLGEKINTNNDASTRRALEPLGQIAEEIGACIVMLRHLNKQGDMKSMYRGGGSIAFIGVARVGLVVDRHPDEDCFVLATVKNNNVAYEAKEYALTYTIEGVQRGAQTVPKVEWGQRIRMSANALVKGKDGRTEAPRTKECMEMILGLFQEAGVNVLPSSQVLAACATANYSKTTINRAKEFLCIENDREYKNGRVAQWLWILPTVAKKQT